MTQDAILGIIRHLLTFGGGFIASTGWASGDEITAGIAALVTLIGLIWSIMQKRKAPISTPPVL